MEMTAYLLRGNLRHDGRFAQIEAFAITCVVPRLVREAEQSVDVADFHISNCIKERDTTAIL